MVLQWDVSCLWWCLWGQAIHLRLYKVNDPFLPDLLCGWTEQIFLAVLDGVKLRGERCLHQAVVQPHALCEKLGKHPHRQTHTHSHWVSLYSRAKQQRTVSVFPSEMLFRVYYTFICVPICSLYLIYNIVYYISQWFKCWALISAGTIKGWLCDHLHTSHNAPQQRPGHRASPDWWRLQMCWRGGVPGGRQHGRTTWCSAAVAPCT